MKLFALIAFTFCCYLSFSQVPSDCHCIDQGFSSSNSEPLAYSRIGENKIAICGYQYSESDEENIGILSSDSSMHLRGYDLILCEEKRSFFSVQEYHTDSIKIHANGFTLFRCWSFPSENGIPYQRIPFLKFSFKEISGQIQVDTSLAIPNKLFSKEYLSQLEFMVDSVKDDKETPSMYMDLHLHYLFLKAISEDQYKKEFINSGPYDGYLSLIFRDFKKILSLKP